MKKIEITGFLFIGLIIVLISLAIIFPIAIICVIIIVAEKGNKLREIERKKETIINEQYNKIMKEKKESGR